MTRKARLVGAMAILVVAIFTLTTLLHVGAQDNRNNGFSLSPTPVVFPPPNQSLYPELICPYFWDIQPGYTWYHVTIGQSTRLELEAALDQFGKYEVVYRQESSLANAIRYRWTGSTQETIISQAPLTVDVCYQDNLVVVMEVNVSQQPLSIHDLAANLGVPDVVTWSWLEDRRIAFWFRVGVASEVFVQHGDSGSFGLAIRMLYFPPQSSEGYETRWPFSVTRSEPFYPVDPSIPNEQNPFDFDMMLATITAQPSRTPTPTLELRSTATATP